ncbi:non-specific lipid-transfer protein 3 [Capsicum annuum]|nr:non-specific lipid-transfer protein 3 [Capsicum annuum]
MAKILLTLFALALILGQTNAVIQCGTDVAPKLISCFTFLLGRATSPSQDCCVGLQGLAKTGITSQSDRKDICMCIRTATQTFAFDYTKAVKLPQLCNYTSAISIEPNLDCSKII